MLLPLVPTILGTAFLAGYVLNVGPVALQAVSYVDIFNFAIIFSIFAFVVVFESIVMVSVYTNLSKSIGDKPMKIFSMAFGFLCLVVAIYFLTITSIRPTKGNTLLFESLIIIVLAPSFFSFVIIQGKLRDLFGTMALVSLASLLFGILAGSYDSRYKSVEDQVCTEKECWRVAVYTVLSEFVVAFDCSHRVFLFPKSEVKRIVMAPSPKDPQDILAKAIADDATCSSHPTPRSDG